MIDPELSLPSLVGLATLCHYAQTPTAAKYGSAISRHLVSLFTCVCLGFFRLVLGLVSFFVWTTQFASWGSVSFLCGVVPRSTMPFSSDDTEDLPVMPRTKPFFTLQSLTHQAAPPSEA